MFHKPVITAVNGNTFYFPASTASTDFNHQPFDYVRGTVLQTVHGKPGFSLTEKQLITPGQLIETLNSLADCRFGNESRVSKYDRGYYYRLEEISAWIDAIQELEPHFVEKAPDIVREANQTINEKGLFAMTRRDIQQMFPGSDAAQVPFIVLDLGTTVDRPHILVGRQPCELARIWTDPRQHEIRLAVIDFVARSIEAFPRPMPAATAFVKQIEDILNFELAVMESTGEQTGIQPVSFDVAFLKTSFARANRYGAHTHSAGRNMPSRLPPPASRLPPIKWNEGAAATTQQNGLNLDAINNAFAQKI